MPISNFSEKIRFILDVINLNYAEETDIAVIGRIVFARSLPNLLDPQTRSTIGNSSEIIQYLYMRLFTAKQSKNDASTLVGVNREKALKFLEPTPLAIELEELIDNNLGFNLQKTGYNYLLKHPESLYYGWGGHASVVPGYQRVILKIIMPALLYFIRTRLVGQANQEKAWQEIFECFDRVDELLEDGRPFLQGSEMTYIDAHFAALAGGYVLSDQLKKSHWANGRFAGDPGSVFPIILPGTADPGVEDKLEKLRESPAGKFAVKMYEEFRNFKLK